MSDQVPVILQVANASDLVARPARAYSGIWHKSPGAINALCAAGKVPGAFKVGHEWWVRPLLLIDWEVEGQGDEKGTGNGHRREAAEQVVRAPKKKGPARRVQRAVPIKERSSNSA